MTTQEKKRFIIDKIKESNSDDFISKIYYDLVRDTTWDETKEGKSIINVLLEKSQQEVADNQTHSFSDVLNDIKEKYGLK
jgi:hypothetical protein